VPEDWRLTCDTLDAHLTEAGGSLGMLWPSAHFSDALEGFRLTVAIFPPPALKVAKLFY
jgi:hypothetical protein